jgi:hypothetical protein
MLGTDGRTQFDQADDLGFAILGPQIEVHTVLHRLALGHLDEHHGRLAVWIRTAE